MVRIVTLWSSIYIFFQWLYEESIIMNNWIRSIKIKFKEIIKALAMHGKGKVNSNQWILPCMFLGICVAIFWHCEHWQEKRTKKEDGDDDDDKRKKKWQRESHCFQNVGYGGCHLHGLTENEAMTEWWDCGVIFLCSNLTM